MRIPAALLLVASSLVLAPVALADNTPQTLPYSQSWSSTGAITTDDSWSGVPGVTGYRGDALTTMNDVDARTVTAPAVELSDTPAGVVDVLANQATPNTNNTGGVAEFEITDPVVALQGSGTADAPFILISIVTTGLNTIVVRYTVRDIDGSADNAAQQVALQYRVGTSGLFTDVPSAYIADATTAGSATQTTMRSITMPSAVDNASVVQLRIITTNATGNDEWVGIDDISITGTAISTGPVCGNGMVESPEQCDGGACCTATCTFQPSTTSCRGAMSDCDATEFCTGTSATCPAVDAAVTPGTACGGGSGFGGGGPAALSCDAPDTCSGTVGATAVCVDNFQPSTFACRAAVGECDATEFCSGTGPTCPVVDAAQTPGTSCGLMPSGVCDAQDVCSGTTGSTASCSARVQPNTTVCRSIAGTCDVIERCNGSTTVCPGDGFLNATNVCRASAGTCDSTEFCSGSAAACPSDSVLPLGTACRASTGVCDPAESCNGFAVCPSDRSAVDGTACADGTTCNGAETCQMGTCRAGAALSCDDRNACTADACAEPGGCENTAIRGCCNIDGDCTDDGDVCTTTRCSGTGGSCEHLPITGCCDSDADCTGGTTCLAVACNLGTNRCETTPVMGCCDADSDCNDSISCTADRCTLATGACTNTDIDGCCVGDGDCDDGDECSTDRCSGGRCSTTPIDGCCFGDTDCMDDDGDACTTPSCNVATERCMEDVVDCDDGDGCTADACESDGSCSHTAISCDDADECTVDSCSAGACEHMDLDGCGLSDAGMPMGDAGTPMDDAGTMVGMDAALPDAGFTNDAASLRTDVPVDAGSLSNVDAGIGENDAGPLDVSMSNCSCRVASPDRTNRGLFLALGLLAMVASRLRRRR